MAERPAVTLAAIAEVERLQAWDAAAPARAMAEYLQGAIREINAVAPPGYRLVRTWVERPAELTATNTLTIVSEWEPDYG